MALSRRRPVPARWYCRWRFWGLFTRRIVAMKTRIGCLLVLIVAGSGPAIAGCDNNPSYLTGAQLTSVLLNNFACGKSAAADPPGWNERHLSGGTLQEQHEGGTTVENVGTWAVAEVIAGRGRVTYTYSPGGSVFSYEVAVHANGNCNTGPPPNCTTLPQAYDFCRVSPAGAALSIYVSTAFQAPPSVGVMNAACPSNP
jgi:hypothetical protein